MSPAIRNYALIFLGCLAFHLAGTWSLPLIDRDEPRFAEASREMRARQDFVVPFFNDEYRFDKPPLTYWAQVASYRLFGENDFAARFPTAIAAALTAMVLLAWGTRIGDVTTGWWSAVIFTLCLQTFLHGKAAVADMWLVLFVTLALFAGWKLRHPEQSEANLDRRNIFAFYLWEAFAFLAKGPIGFVPVLTLLCSRARTRQPGEENRVHRETSQWAHVAGFALMVAIICAWGIPALVRTHGEFWKVGIGKHVVARSVATMEGHGASSPLMYVALLPFYFVTVFASFFPWSLKIPALFRQLRQRSDETDKFLLIGAAIIFGIFTLVKTKLPHYTLPAFPLLALLLAKHAAALRLSRRMFVAWALFLFLFALIAPPIFARHFPSYQLARETAARLSPETAVATIDFNEPSVVWYFRGHVHGFVKTVRRNEAEEFMTSPGPRALVLPTAMADRIFSLPNPAWSRARASGFNIPKGQRADLTLLLKPR